MKLIEQKYHVDRGNSAETYQSLTVTMEHGGNRRYILMEIDFMQRWRSPAECADYLRWCAAEIEKLPV